MQSKYFQNIFISLKGSWYQLALLFMLFVTVGTSCKKFIAIDPPLTSVVTISVFNNTSLATSAMLNIYQKMYSASYSGAVDNGLLSDELTYSGGIVSFQQLYKNSLTTSQVFGPWTTAYNYIYQSNAVIEGLGNSPISAAVKKQLTAEARFVRAFWHFYLASFYGDVPVVTGTDYSINVNLSRTPRDQVYQQVTADLLEANRQLSDLYVDGSDTAMSTERVRPSRWASEAMLARVYLYRQKYDSAELHSSQVINNTLFRLPSLDSAFVSISPEAIWQLATPLNSGSNSGQDTYDGHFFILTAAGDYQVSSFLRNSFEMGDNRKSGWIGSVTVGSPAITYYFPYKYKIRDDPSPNTTEEYTMVLRLAEQYLIRAEARIKQGNTGGALADLNVIRHRAGLPDYAGPTDQASLLLAIFHERQVELFTEWGHRWLDMIRMGYANAVMGSPGNVCQSKGGTWSPYWQLYPIPESERNNDPNLSQNPGY